MSRVLVIEDQLEMVRGVTRALSARGLAVDGARDGLRGLELARTGSYDVVVLDVRLPGLNGIDVLKVTLEAQPGQQVIVLSALSDVEVKVKCLELGAADYMTKPFALSELIARVRARLRERGQGNGERF